MAWSYSPSFEFTLAVFGLLSVPIGTLYADVGKLRIETADNAVRIARGALEVNEVPDRIEKIELIKGSDVSLHPRVPGISSSTLGQVILGQATQSTSSSMRGGAQ